MVILENIDIDIDIDIDNAILQNIDIDKISNRFKFGISNRATRIRTRVCKDFGLRFLKWFSPLDDRETLYILSPGFCFGFPLTPSPPTNSTHLLTRNLPAVKIYNRVSCQAGIVVSGSVMTSRALPHTILSRRPLTAPTKPLSVNLEPIF